MSFLKSLIISIAASLVFGGLFFLLCYGTSSGKGGVPRASHREVGAGYAVLTLDAAYPDALIQDLLADEGIVNVLGESSQWVFLDDFGELERVPLDAYRERVEPFDLRNDGYAERLRSLFVAREERRLFIPLGSGASKNRAFDLEERIAAALGDILFTVTITGPPESVVLPALLFAVVAALTMIFSGAPLAAAFLLPLWAVPAGMGAAGFSLMAALAGFFRLLRDPLREYFIFHRYGKPDDLLDGGGMGELMIKIFNSHGVSCVLSPLFLAAYIVSAVIGGLSLVGVFMGLIFFLVLLILAFWTESMRGMNQGHIRFLPVQITDIAMKPLSFSRVILPFALASLGMFFLPTPVTDGNTGAPAVSRELRDWKRREGVYDPALLPRAYQDHVRFQNSFSLTPLDLDGYSQSYLRYTLGKDGLIAGSSAPEGDPSGLFPDGGSPPPFPLAGLIDFLENNAYTSFEGFPAGEARVKKMSVVESSHGGDLASVLISLGLCIPLILLDSRGRRIRGKFSAYMDKRIAA
jgi:hypothetical protein